MAKCTRCGDEVNLDNEDAFLLVCDVGIFCSACVVSLAEEGVKLALQHCTELGESVVVKRVTEIAASLDANADVNARRH